MKIKVYRGTKEIGGTCIEITADNGKKIWIDLGSPLSNDNPDIEYAKNSVDALLISHPHQDHYGLIDYIKPATPVFMGQVSQGLINATRIFLKKPLLDRNISVVTPWKCITVADAFKVEPYLVDHSSPEAFAFLIEADGKKIFYSGDFRATGRKSKLFFKMLEMPPQNIDLLLMEGTMVNRSKCLYPTEKAVEDEISRIVKNQKNVSFVISSAQNIDRFCSVFSACKKANKTVVIDIYNAWVLEVVGKLSPRLPKFDLKSIKIFMHPNQLKRIQGDEFKEFRQRIEKNSIANEAFNNPSGYVYFLRNPNIKLIDKLRHKGKINLIYSMWEGYLTEEHKTYFTDNINKLKNENDIEFRAIHTSGHATMEDLKKLAKSINPALVVPIHTSYPEDFEKDFVKDGFTNVRCWQDNMEYEI